MSEPNVLEVIERNVSALLRIGVQMALQGIELAEKVHPVETKHFMELLDEQDAREVQEIIGKAVENLKTVFSEVIETKKDRLERTWTPFYDDEP